MVLFLGKYFRMEWLRSVTVIKITKEMTDRNNKVFNML